MMREEKMSSEETETFQVSPVEKPRRKETVAIKNVFVIGAGVMGGGIAQVSAEAGYSVTMMDIKDEFVKLFKYI